MKFATTQPQLSEVLSKVVRGLGKTHLPQLQGCLIKVEGEKAKFTVSDGYTAIRSWLAVESQEDGVALIPARQLHDTVVSARKTEKITLASDGQDLKIGSGAHKATIKGYDSLDYPDIPSGAEGDFAALPAGILQAWGKYLAPFVANDDNRPVLQNISVSIKDGVFRAQCADGFQMSYLESDAGNFPNQSPILLEAEILKAKVLPIFKDGVVSMWVSTNKIIFFRDAYSEVLVQQMEGNFPDAISIVAKNEFAISALCNVSDVQDMLKRVTPFVTTRSDGKGTVAFVNTKLVLDDGMLEVSVSGDTGNATDWIVVDHQGEAITIWLSPSYLYDALSVVGGGKAKLQFAAPNRPIKITSPDVEGWVWGVMPRNVEGQNG